VSFQKHLDQEVIHARCVGHDLLVAFLLVRHSCCQLQPVESTFAGQRLAPIAFLLPLLAVTVSLVHHYRQQRIRSQFIVIIKILVAQCQRVNPLRNQLFYPVFDLIRTPVIAKTGREALENSSAPLRLSQQQTAAV
jgi:hypothetical protein